MDTYLKLYGDYFNRLNWSIIGGGYSRCWILKEHIEVPNKFKEGFVIVFTLKLDNVKFRDLSRFIYQVNSNYERKF